METIAGQQRSFNSFCAPAKDCRVTTGSENRQLTGWYRFVLLLALVATGLYAQFLQHKFYEVQAPFFDSVQYYDRVYEVVSIRQQEGLIPAIQNAAMEKSTFCFPYLLAVPISYITQPTRAIGVWIEVFYLAVFVFSLAEYLRRVCRSSSSRIVLSLLPVFLISAIYRSNSGLSDLRVDMPLGFLYASTACWWLIGRNDGRWSAFVIAGILAGIACLTRGIAPIYLICGFIPLVIAEFFLTKEKAKLAIQAGLVMGLAGILSAWFYIKHFKFLYFYYAVWNTDANAAVSFSRSLRHFAASYKSIGIIFTIFFVAAWIGAMYSIRNRSVPVDSSGPDSRGIKQQDLFRLLWVGLAPILMLIAKGAGINPFVSLPGSIGILAAAVVLLNYFYSTMSIPMQKRLAFTALIFLAVAWIDGYRRHTEDQSPTMAGHQELIGLIEADAKASGRSHVTYSVNIITKTCAPSLKSILQYDRNSKYVDRITTEVDGIRYSISYKLMNPSKANWDRLAGDTIDEKIKLLELHATSNVDYVVTMARRSVPLVQANYGHDYAMQFADKILDAFDNPEHWQAISGEIDMEPGVAVQLLKNVSTVRSTSVPTKSKPAANIR